MNDIINIRSVNQVYNKIVADPGIMMEIRDYFTFDVPGAKFMPKFKARIWDGKVRLCNPLNGLLYVGLNKQLEKFAASRKYDINYEYDNSSVEFSIKEANDFIKTLNIPEKYTPRDYQIKAFVHAVRERRALLLSPTASGKSLIIYLLLRYYLFNDDKDALIIVPTIQLVSQLAGDFEDYGFDGTLTHKIHGGVDKNTNKPVTISTWQSVYKQHKSYFEKFGMIVGDEAHLFKANSLTSILHKLENCKFRYGFTGTLDGTQTNKLVLEGIFGPVNQVTTTSELMDSQHLAKFDIKCIVLKHPEYIRKQNNRLSYQEEIDFIVTNEHRNKFICNLALSLKGNTLILFQFVEKQGKPLFELMNKLNDSTRNIYMVYGGVDGESREEIRRIVDTENDAIIIASFGTTSTGSNIPSLRNVIFASSSKSRIRVLQSIGRGLRKSLTKTENTLYDISDDLSWKANKNTTLVHLMERIKLYNQESFNYKIYSVSINY